MGSVAILDTAPKRRVNDVEPSGWATMARQSRERPICPHFRNSRDLVPSHRGPPMGISVSCIAEISLKPGHERPHFAQEAIARHAAKRERRATLCWRADFGSVSDS